MQPKIIRTIHPHPDQTCRDKFRNCLSKLDSFKIRRKNWISQLKVSILQ